MIHWTRTAGILLIGLSLMGCATSSGTRGKGADSLTARVETLENQVTSLHQQLDETTTQALPPAEEALGSSAPGRAPGAAKTRLTVRQVQKALTAAGYYKGSIDGKGGPQTQKAIKAFQQAQGLKADGVVGSATTEALGKSLNE